MVEIRSAAADDAGELAEFAEEMFRATYARFNRPEDIDTYAAEAFSPSSIERGIADPFSLFLLALHDGSLCGYAHLRFGIQPDALRLDSPAELARLYVAAEWQGRGVAQRLLAAGRERAVSRGCRVLWLAVWEQNARARAFYEKLRFRHAGSQEFLLGEDRQRDLVMTLELR